MTVNSDGETPLHTAVKEGSRAAVELLRQNGVDLMVRIHLPGSPSYLSGATPLHLAAINGHYTIAEYLLEHSAEVDATTLEHSTPLHFAAQGAHLQQTRLVALLIEHGTDVNAVDVIGQTPLHYAVREQRLALVELLLANGADPNLAGFEKRTPLHLAVERSSFPLVDLLIEHGVEINATDIRERTPLDYLSDERGSERIASLLNEHGAHHGRFHAQVIHGDREQFVFWDRSEAMTLPEVLRMAGIDPESIRTTVQVRFYDITGSHTHGSTTSPTFPQRMDDGAVIEIR